MRITGKLTIWILLWASCAYGQQFNSDSWLSKKHGVITLIPTVGQRNTMLMTTYSLFPKWEFTMAAYLFNDDGDPNTNDGYSSSLYAKYMFYENENETGGAAIKAGTGMFPGYFDEDARVKDAFRTFWTNMPVTIPLFDNKLSVDLMPGASVTVNYGDTHTSSWAMTYATRFAWYPKGDQVSIVTEVFGAVSENENTPEYKAGIRWERNPHVVFAITYGQEFNGNNGAGLEFGVMLFTPAFACLKQCK